MISQHNHNTILFSPYSYKSNCVIHNLTHNWKVRKGMLSQSQAQIPVWSISL